MLFHNGLKLLSKNRDKSAPEVEEIVKTPDLIAVRTRGSSYYSLAINRHGLAFVSTAINTPEWTRLIEGQQHERAKTIFAIENRGLSSPTQEVSAHFADMQTTHDVVDLLKGAEKMWMGYNVVVYANSEALVIETYREEVVPRRLADIDVVTNHFSTIQHGALTQADYPNSFARYDYVRSRFSSLDSLDTFKAIINPKDAHDQKKIWRNAAFRTISSSILDLENLGLYYTTDPQNDYEYHQL